MRCLTALVLALLLVPSMGAADTMYKWVDAQGNVHYSDKPAPGATKINMPKAPTFKAPVVAQANPTSAPDGLPTTVAYSAVVISSPADQDTLWNTDTVTVSASTTPGLQPGDNLIITVDGTSKTANGGSATFDGLDRGQHTASASAGGVSSKPVTFFIQKNTAKKPPSH